MAASASVVCAHGEIDERKLDRFAKLHDPSLRQEQMGEMCLQTLDTRCCGRVVGIGVRPSETVYEIGSQTLDSHGPVSSRIAAKRVESSRGAQAPWEPCSSTGRSAIVQSA